MHITIRVPATSANLGPGFDTLGLALDLWNETIITLAIEYTVQIHGEGAEKLSLGENNLIIQSAQKLAECVGKRLPPFHLGCVNHIPLSSGLGSSAAAKLTGLLGANTLLGNPLIQDEILDLATEMEDIPITLHLHSWVVWSFPPWTLAGYLLRRSNLKRITIPPSMSQSFCRIFIFPPRKHAPHCRHISRSKTRSITSAVPCW